MNLHKCKVITYLPIFVKKTYSLKSLIPNIRKSNPTNTTKTTIPPLISSNAAKPHKCNGIPGKTSTIGPIIRIRPNKISIHLFI